MLMTGLLQERTHGSLRGGKIKLLHIIVHSGMPSYYDLCIVVDMTVIAGRNG